MNTQEKEALNSMEEEMESALNRLNIPLSSQQKQLLKETIMKMEQHQLSPSEALGCTPEMREVIYNHGYKLFYSGKYQEALPVFSTLRALDPTDPRYSFALAACYHRNKEYLNAAAHYTFSHFLDPSEPYSCFYLYDCFMKANHPVSALSAIQEAFVLAESNPKYEELKMKIALERQHLQEFLKTNSHKKET